MVIRQRFWVSLGYTLLNVIKPVLELVHRSLNNCSCLLVLTVAIALRLILLIFVGYSTHRLEDLRTISICTVIIRERCIMLSKRVFNFIVYGVFDLSKL